MLAAPPTDQWRPTGTRTLRPPGEVTPEAFDPWRTRAVERLTDLLALPPVPVDSTLIIDDRPAPDDPEPQLIMLRTGDVDVPCWLLRPPAGRRLDAAVVAIAGHGRGIDDLVANDPDDEDYHGGLARKLAGAGFTVLCPEMISFGRRRTTKSDPAAPTPSSCPVDAMRGMLTGQPVLGRRVADALAAVRAVRHLDGVDPTRIAVLGGSGGGAVALLAAALDDQIAGAVVGTYLSSFAASLGSVPHCSCNAVPDLLTWFEMADLAAMIAPRRLIIEAGRQDPIFPVADTESAYTELVGVWQGLGVEPPDLVITDAGHQFRADDSITLLRARLASTTLILTTDASDLRFVIEWEESVVFSDGMTPEPSHWARIVVDHRDQGHRFPSLDGFATSGRALTTVVPHSTENPSASAARCQAFRRSTETAGSDQRVRPDLRYYPARLPQNLSALQTATEQASLALTAA